VLLGDDVVRLMRKQNISLVNEAVLAATCGSFTDCVTQSYRDVRATHAALANLWRARAFTNAMR